MIHLEEQDHDNRFQVSVFEHHSKRLVDTHGMQDQSIATCARGFHLRLCWELSTVKHSPVLVESSALIWGLSGVFV